MQAVLGVVRYAVIHREQWELHKQDMDIRHLDHLAFAHNAGKVARLENALEIYTNHSRHYLRKRNRYNDFYHFEMRRFLFYTSNIHQNIYLPCFTFYKITPNGLR